MMAGEIGHVEKVGSLSIARIEEFILHIKVEENAIVDIDDMKGYMQYIGKTFQGLQFVNIVEFGSLTNVSAEARAYAASEDSNQFTIADAFVVKSLSQRLLGGFYLRMDKPVKPTKFCKNYDEAYRWAKSILVKRT